MDQNSQKKAINIKPGKANIPVVMPAKKQAIEALTVDERMKFIYSGLIIADTIDGYILELANDIKNVGLFRQGFKASLNEMKRKIESYKVIMFRSCYFSDSLRQELADSLDTLDDTFRHDITVLFYSIKRYVSKFISNPDHATCISRASVIERLSAYSLRNDDIVSRAMTNATGRNIRLEDTNIRTINFQSKKLTGDLASIHGKAPINLDDCDEFVTAFLIIDKKMEKVHEYLKQTA